jgi:hypothetical protein
VTLVRKRTIPTDWATATCWRNLVPTFTDRGVSRGQRGGSPTVVNLSFLDRSRYFSFKRLLIYSHKGWVDPVPDPLLLRKSSSARNRTRDLWVCSQELWPLDHRGGHITANKLLYCHLTVPLHFLQERREREGICQNVNGSILYFQVAKLFSYTWSMGFFLCKGVHYLQNVSAICSVLTLTAMSIERWAIFETLFKM